MGANNFPVLQSERLANLIAGVSRKGTKDAKEKAYKKTFMPLRLCVRKGKLISAKSLAWDAYLMEYRYRQHLAARLGLGL